MPEDVTDMTVLEVLLGQHEEYYIWENASAFIAAGIVPTTADVELKKLEKEGLVEREVLIPIVRTADEVFATLDADAQVDHIKAETFPAAELGEQVTGGWRLTDAARKKLLAERAAS